MLKKGVVAKSTYFDKVIRRVVYFSDLYLPKVTNFLDMVCSYFVNSLF